jgi:hypothetical protein
MTDRTSNPRRATLKPCTRWRRRQHTRLPGDVTARLDLAKETTAGIRSIDDVGFERVDLLGSLRRRFAQRC